MSFRFFRRHRLLPGVTLNLSKSGASVSLGPRGAKVTVGPRGTHATVGLPGTGLFYTTKVGSSKSTKSRAGNLRNSQTQTTQAPSSLDLGFFSKLLLLPEERLLVEGLRLLVDGEESAAQSSFQRSTHPDAAWMLGILALQRGDTAAAIPHLEQAAAGSDRLGGVLQRHGISTSFTLPVTPELEIHVEAGIHGCWLTLAELYQWVGRKEDAIRLLEQLLPHVPADLALLLSWAELLYATYPHDAGAMQAILEKTNGLTHETALHAACLLYRARALRSLGRMEEARVTLTSALKRKAGRPQDLIHALLYERAMVFELQGQTAKARKDLQSIAAQNDNYEDVRQRLEVR